MVDIFKCIGILLVVLSAALCGNMMAVRLSKRASILTLLAQLCIDVGEKIRFFGTPVEQIIEQCRGKYSGLNFLKTYPNVVTGYPLERNEAESVKEFFDGLGISDVYGQQKHCDAYALRFKRLADNAKAECESKNKLYRVLGLFLGICISVLLI